MLSPTMRVREFSITDVQPYAVRLAWDSTKDEGGDMEVYISSLHYKMLFYYLRDFVRAPFNLPSL